jgi:Undecaprenyl-phosphate glucose phosphotransferase
VSSRVSGTSEARQQRSLVRPLPVEAVRPLLAGLDIVVIVSLSIVNGLAYHLLVLQQAGSIDVFGGSGLMVAALFVAVLQSNDMYGLHSRKPDLGKIALIWTLIFLFLTAVAFILKVSDQFSRGSVLSFYVSGLGALLLVRVAAIGAVRSALASGTLLGRRVAVVTENSELAGGELLQILQAYGCRIENLVILPERRRESDEPEAAIRSGRTRDLVTSVRQAWADEVILALNWSHPDRVTDAMAALRMLPIPVRLVPDRATRKLLEGHTTSIGPVIAVELQRAPLSTLEQAVKRCLDITASACGIFVLLPLLAVAAFAVRLDSPGPILFRQTRMGFNGRPFRIYKFRSMHVLDDGPRIQQARRNDPRVTRVGHWLRTTSIDELPQLINVLKGDMSLVGPRPHAIAHDNEYDQMIADYALRYHMKPGITGWAQVNGLRGETPTVNLMKRRVDHDLWYIKHWSFWLDIKILLKTIASQIHHQDVY